MLWNLNFHQSWQNNPCRAVKCFWRLNRWLPRPVRAIWLALSAIHLQVSLYRSHLRFSLFQPLTIACSYLASWGTVLTLSWQYGQLKLIQGSFQLRLPQLLFCIRPSKLQELVLFWGKSSQERLGTWVVESQSMLICKNLCSSNLLAQCLISSL